jgi:adenine deaminase
MLCSDDLHPDGFQHGHIDRLVRRALDEGHDLFAVLRAACINPVDHYRLSVGLLRPGDPADFIVVDDLRGFRVGQTYIDGRLVADDGRPLIERVEVPVMNRFGATAKSVSHFHVPARGGQVRVMQAHDGQLVTDELHVPAKVEGGRLVSDPATDVLKIAVVNRYAEAPPAVAFVRGFGLRRGAIAASVAHDSHNIVAVGVSDEDLCGAVNAVVEAKGGLAVADGSATEVLPLEIAGLMSRDGAAVAAGYARLDAKARGLGSPLTAPFMTLSFMALLVIPALKLSDRGLFDGQSFRFTTLDL